jgi:hypothetical protein
VLGNLQKENVAEEEEREKIYFPKSKSDERNSVLAGTCLFRTQGKKLIS